MHFPGMIAAHPRALPLFAPDNVGWFVGYIPLRFATPMYNKAWDDFDIGGRFDNLILQRGLVGVNHGLRAELRPSTIPLSLVSLASDDPERAIVETPGAGCERFTPEGVTAWLRHFADWWMMMPDDWTVYGVDCHI